MAQPPVHESSEPDERFRVLAVCTGNICRSPAAELLLRHLLIGRRGGREASRVEVSSAGVAAVVGSGIHPMTRAELAPWGLGSRADAHMAQQLDDGVVEGVDLVLGMTRRHRSAVLERYPQLLDRTFALREFVRLMAAAETSMLPADLVKRGRGMVDLAPVMRGTVRPVDDTVPDPMGGPQRAHQDAVWLVAAAMQGIVDVLAPRSRAASATSAPDARR